MNWSLLLSDLLARVVGVLGLIASVAWIAGISVGWPGLGPAAQFGAGSALFCLTMTLFFLLPQYHDRMMHRTVPTVLRVPFQIIGGAWCLAVIGGLFLAGAALDGVLAQNVSGLFWPIASAVALIATMILIFPGGLAWREPSARREMQAVVSDDRADDVFEDAFDDDELEYLGET